MLRKFSVVLVSLTVSLLAAEGGLRLWGTFGLEYIEMDTTLGWRYRSNASYKAWVISEAVCGWGSEGRINSRGLRDREYPYDKPPGTFRILALGDSFTAAVEHPVEQTWTKVLERRLNARQGRTAFEVINAGRGAAGTGYEYLWFDTEGYRYSPDLVILVVIGNDLTDNSRALVEREPRSWLWDPFFEVREGRLVADTSFRDTWGFLLRQMLMPVRAHSELVRTLLAVRQLAASGRVAVTIQPSYAPAAELASAVETTRQLIRELRARVEARGASLVVFNGLPDYLWGLEDQPDTLMRELAAEESGWFYRDLVAPLDRYTADTGRRAFGCSAMGDRHLGHWSREGHAEVARLIQQALADFHLLDGGDGPGSSAANAPRSRFQSARFNPREESPGPARR